MFAKTIIAFSTALALATAFASAAQAQRPTTQRVQPMQPHSDFEKLWFQIPEGDL